MSERRKFEDFVGHGGNEVDLYNIGIIKRLGGRLAMQFANSQSSSRSG